jgi:hypothetical protein
MGRPKAELRQFIEGEGLSPSTLPTVGPSVMAVNVTNATFPRGIEMCCRRRTKLQTDEPCLSAAGAAVSSRIVSVR